MKKQWKIFFCKLKKLKKKSKEKNYFCETHAKKLQNGQHK